MAIGRTFPESLQKGLRSLEQGRLGLGLRPGRGAAAPHVATTSCWPPIAMPTPERIFQVGELLRRGVSIDAVHDACRIDPWFLDQMGMIIEERAALAERRPRRAWTAGRGGGPSGSASATPSSRHLWGADELIVRAAREAAGVLPTYKTVDTCAAEFAAETPYHYSPTRTRTRSAQSTGRRSSSSAAARTASGRASSSTTAACTPRSRCARPGFETVMINCNPETVSTDYDTSDRLYFEPLTREDVLNVIAAETAASGGVRAEGDRLARRADAAEAGRPAAGAS